VIPEDSILSINFGRKPVGRKRQLLAGFVTGKLEDENIRHGDYIAFHTTDFVIFTTLRVPSRIRSCALQIDRCRYLLTDSTSRQSMPPSSPWSQDEKACRAVRWSAQWSLSRHDRYS